MLILEDACQTLSAHRLVSRATGMRHGFKENRKNAGDWLTLLLNSIYATQCSTWPMTSNGNQITQHFLQPSHSGDANLERHNAGSRTALRRVVRPMPNAQ